MARYIPLFSSSSGNCHLLSSKGKSLLIDAGVSCKKILSALDNHQINTNSIEGILITHEHIDHVKGLAILADKLNIPVYATEKTLAILEEKGNLRPQTKAISLANNMEIGGMGVNFFNTPHDCCHSVGFRIHTGDNRTFAFATDLGHITPQVLKGLQGANTIVIESNYDMEMLRTSSYPYYLKERIAGSVGHLSNKDCSNLCIDLVKKGTSRIILAHLSKENNTPQIAYNTVRETLATNAMEENVDFLLHTAPVENTEKVISF